MIIFLYGQDAYRLNKEAKSVIEKYSKKHSSGVNLFSFDLGLDSAKNIEDAIKTVSFFNEVRLIAIKNAFLVKDSDSLSGLIKEYDLVSDKDVVLLVKENLSEKEVIANNKKLFSLLAGEKNLVRNFENFQGAKLEDWVRKEFIARGCNISSVLAKKLIEAAGKNSIHLSCEIDKLSNYRVKGEVESGDIDSLVTRDIEPNVFEFLDAITVPNKVRALELLYKELKTGRDPHYILTMIVYQFRNMLVLKDLFGRNLSSAQIAKMTKMHPFVISKLKNYLNRNISEIKDNFDYLARVDVFSKQGKTDIGDCLYNFVLNC